MKNLLKWVLRILFVLVLAAAVIGFWKREEIKRLMAVNSLFSEEKIVRNFSHMDEAFLTADLPRGDGPVSELPYGPGIDLPEGADEWLDERTVTSLLVMQDGQIRFEEYYQGTAPEDRRISWSVAKSYLSTLLGIVMAEGAIDSIDDPVVKYVPELKGTAYDKVTIRNALNMSSGVTFNEDYFDYNSDINRMGRVIALGGKLDEFSASLQDTYIGPGEKWQYVSIDTHVIGMVIRGATGRSVVDLLTEKVVQPLGLEQDGYYITDGDGVAFVLGGLNFTTRDFARFGQMILQGGEYNGQQLVSAEWINEAVAPTAPTAPGDYGYGYQWWVPTEAHEGEFLARGVYGQHIYFDRPRGLVIVVTSADRKFRAPGASDSNMEMFRKIAESL